MLRQGVKSSDLLSVGYHSGTLEIEFKNNSIYQYLDVPEYIYHELVNSDSKGKYFNQNIRNIFRCMKI